MSAMSGPRSPARRAALAGAGLGVLLLVLLGWLLTRSTGAPRLPALSGADPAVAPASVASVPVERAARDPLAGAATPAPSAPSSDPAPPVERFARLHARSVDTAGAVAAHATYLALPLDETGAPRIRRAWRAGVTDDQGRLRLDELEPGRWILTMSATYRPPQRFDLQLPPGLTGLGDVRFALARFGHDLEVRLAPDEEDGDPHGFLHVRSLFGEDVDRWNWIGRVQWVANRLALPLTFTFHGLPAGRYELSFLRCDRWSHEQRVEVEVPCEEVVFETSNAGTPLRVVTRALDGSPLAAEFVLLAPGRTEHFNRSVELGDALVGTDPGGTFRWVLLAEGCLPRQGTQADFRASGGELRLEAVLEPGVGVLVIACNFDPAISVPTCGGEIDMARDHMPPLAGLELAVDGRLAARTDAAGVALVVLGSPEARLEVLGPTHVVVEQQNLAAERVERLRYPVVLRCASRR